MAGLQVGDVILKYDNQTPSDERALLRTIAKSTIGQAVPITVLRAGHDQAFQVKPIAWPDTEPTSGARTATRPEMLVPANLGLSLNALTPDLRARNGLLMQQTGVVIDGVAAGTDAFDRGLAPGDVILRVQDADVRSPQQVQAAVDAARAEHKEFVLVLVLPKVRQTPGPRWMALRISES
jgi:serine protease Do